MKSACLLLAMMQAITYIPSHDSKFVAGTISVIPTGMVGTLDANDQNLLVFRWTKKGSGEWHVPHEKVTAIWYGQHAERRVGAAVGAGVATWGIGAVPFLFSKKRRHNVRVEFQDEQGKQQVAIFNVGKGAIRGTLRTLEARTQKKVLYEDAEAENFDRQ